MDLVNRLDSLRHNWREIYLVLLDNMNSYKTKKESLKLFDTLRLPYIFSAATSYKSIPVESVIKHMNLTDFRSEPIPQRLKIKDIRDNHLTHKKQLLSQIAHFILEILDDKMRSIFYERLQNLRSFLALERVWAEIASMQNNIDET